MGLTFHYLVAAHNEGSNVDRACARLAERHAGQNDVRVMLLENGSTDDTWDRCLAAASKFPEFVVARRCEGAGLGLAFRTGLEELTARDLSRDDWVVLAACDLPFGFSDLEQVYARAPRSRAIVFVGSKALLQSRVPRGLKRRFGSWIFYVLRRALIGLKTRDPQGSIILRGDQVGASKNFESDDYFFSVELIDRAERRGEVCEVPVTLEPEVRPSRVRLVRDGARAIRQLWRYRRRRAYAAVGVTEPGSSERRS